MARHNISLHSTESFREQYMQQAQQLNSMLKPGFGKFFIVKVQDLIRLIKLPVPPIRSTTHTLICLTEGEATMSIGSSTHVIHAGECMIVPAGQVYSFSKYEVNKGYLCNFHNDMIVGKFGKNELLKELEFLQVWANPRIVPGREAAGYISQLMKRIYAAYTKHGLDHLDIIQSYFIALLCELSHAYQPGDAAARTPAADLSNRFRTLLFKYVRSKHLVSEYAAMLHITPNHLNKAVKAATGRSPIKWIDEAIVLEAKVLLHQSSLSVQEVAAEVGLLDPSYFARLFKKQEGVSPLAFRRRIEKS